MDFGSRINARLAFYGLGQVGVVISDLQSGAFLVIDPYLTASIETEQPQTEFVRAFAPPCQPEDLQGALGVLITHHHGDHLDLETLRRLADTSPQTHFAVPAPSVAILEEIAIDGERRIEAREGETFSLGPFTITPIGAAHTSYEFDEYGDHVFLGYFIEIDGVRLYHAGDTVATDELQDAVRGFAPQAAFLPINGGDFARASRDIVGNMNYREALDLASATGIDLVFPVHIDLFPNNRENPSYFVDYLYARYPMQKFHMLMAGERYLYAP
ncbi:MAG: MBL fold metallo-hydrolase [Firmicutes bacterium]|nr:MBL fold metallo-hydrolase [Bacillota bacterium]